MYFKEFDQSIVIALSGELTDRNIVGNSVMASTQIIPF